LKGREASKNTALGLLQNELRDSSGLGKKIKEKKKTHGKIRPVGEKSGLRRGAASSEKRVGIAAGEKTPRKKRGAMWKNSRPAFVLSGKRINLTCISIKFKKDRMQIYRKNGRGLTKRNAQAPELAERGGEDLRAMQGRTRDKTNIPERERKGSCREHLLIGTLNDC